jgi:hypothetical protein
MTAFRRLPVTALSTANNNFLEICGLQRLLRTLDQRSGDPASLAGLTLMFKLFALISESTLSAIGLDRRVRAMRYAATINGCHAGRVFPIGTLRHGPNFTEPACGSGIVIELRRFS